MLCPRLMAEDSMLAKNDVTCYLDQEMHLFPWESIPPSPGKHVLFSGSELGCQAGALSLEPLCLSLEPWHQSPAGACP